LALAVLAVVCPLAAGAWWWVTADGNEAPLLEGDSPTSASDPGSRPDVEETAVASVATSSAALDAGTAPSAQATDRTAAPDPVAPPTAWRPSPKPDCTDPFVIDDQGIKRVRRECL
jgi:cytoskeletal protein RodZ